MKRLAPELDSLIWTLVEKGNARAIEEFLARYPEMKQEVARRSLMVKGLKELKPEAAVEFAPPPFRPAEHVRYQRPTRMVYIVAALVLAALGVASFTVTYIALPKQVEAPVVEVEVPQADPETFAETGPPPKAQEPSFGELGPEDEQPIKTKAPTVQAPKAIAITIEDAPLHTVFDLIAAESGLQVIVAPGTPNPSIGVDYKQMTPLEILRDMGREHGFTPMDQGDGSIIIVPAVENGTSGRMRPRIPERPSQADRQDGRSLTGTN